MRIIVGCWMVLLMAVNTQAQQLYPMVESSRWGYINREGEVKIKPQFQAVGVFSEGLAPVRVGGLYGYIDIAGTMVISPQFDMALDFNKGIAQAFLGSKPYIINTQGQVLFEHSFKYLDISEDRQRIIAFNNPDYKALLNRWGRQLTDTVFRNLKSAPGGKWLVADKEHYPWQKKDAEQYKIGIIDSVGKWVVPYGVYRDIWNFEGDYARVMLMSETKEEPDYNGVINKDGKLLFIAPAGSWTFDDREYVFSENRAVVMGVAHKKMHEAQELFDYGLINEKGELLTSDPEWQEMTTVSHGGAFVQKADDKWYLINNNGKYIRQEGYDELLFKVGKDHPETLFEGGYAVVRQDQTWKLIAPSGKPFRKRLEFDAGASLLSKRNGLLFNHNRLINLTIGQYREPDGELVKWWKDQSMFLYQKDGRWLYVDKRGKEQWRQAAALPGTEKLNIDYRNYVRYPSPTFSERGRITDSGWVYRDERWKWHKTDSIPVLADTFQLYIDTSKAVTWNGQYQGWQLYLVNTSAISIPIRMVNRDVQMKLEALDPSGVWQEIEQDWPLFCAVAIFEDSIVSGQFQKMVVPVYDGTFRTQIRAVLTVGDDFDHPHIRKYYSNSIEGSINPAQLWLNENVWMPELTPVSN